MNRHTLEERIRAELDMDVYQFAQALGVGRETLRVWHKRKRLMLKIAISGYKREVRGE